MTENSVVRAHSDERTKEAAAVLGARNGAQKHPARCITALDCCLFQTGTATRTKVAIHAVSEPKLSRVHYANLHDVLVIRVAVAVCAPKHFSALTPCRCCGDALARMGVVWSAEATGDSLWAAAPFLKV